MSNVIDLLLNADFQIHENNRPLEWVYGSNVTPTVSEDGVQLVSTGTTAISQYMTISYSQLANKNVTLSAKMNNQIYSATATIPTDVPTATTGETVYINLRINENSINGYLKFTWANSTSQFRAYYYFSAEQTITMSYMKLELGQVATPFVPNTLETYVNKNYFTLNGFSNYIPQNADLNSPDYLEVGNYIQGRSTYVQSLLNCPTNNGFTMHVSASVENRREDLLTDTYTYRVRTLIDFLGNTYIQAVYTDGTASEFIYMPWKKQVSQEDVSNPNLLINGDFRVNQRGLPSYIGSAIYTVDRWSTVMGTTKVTVIDNGVNISLSSQYGKFRQRLKDFEYLKGKTVTISAKISNLNDLRNNLYFQIYQLKSSGSGDESIRVRITTNGVVYITGTILKDITALYVEFYTWNSGTEETTFDIEWVKLELGTCPTIFTPKTYMEELNDCLSYYYKISQPWKYVGYGICSNATTAYIVIDLPKPMITKPKVTISDPSLVRIKCGALTGQATNQDTTETDGLTVDGFTYDTIDSIISKLNFGFTVSGATAGAFAILYIDKDGSIEFDAEI